MKLHRSAKEPDTSVAAVAAKTNWKNHLESLWPGKREDWWQICWFYCYLKNRKLKTPKTPEFSGKVQEINNPLKNEKWKLWKNSGKVRKINKFSKNWNLKLWILPFHGYFSFCIFFKKKIISAEIEIRRFHSLEILDLFWFWIGQWKLSDLKFKRSDWLLNFQKRKQNSVYLKIWRESLV